ncbi:TPA: deaminase domain-containing protein [Bacillus cereus]
MQTLYSRSQIDYLTDPYLHYAKEDNLFAPSCAILRKDKIFTTLELSSKDSLLPYDRYVDTEAKLLEQIRFLADTFKPTKGIVNLFTELHPCTSCKNVIDQFEKRYNGNITLNVFHEK